MTEECKLLMTSSSVSMLKSQEAVQKKKQGSEAGHKEERYAREHQSRKCDLISGDMDSFRHKWVASDPGQKALVFYMQDRSAQDKGLPREEARPCRTGRSSSDPVLLLCSRI